MVQMSLGQGTSEFQSFRTLSFISACVVMCYVLQWTRSIEITTEESREENSSGTKLVNSVRTEREKETTDDREESATETEEKLL